MIRVLTQGDHSRVMRFLKKKPIINHYIIADIENYGYEQTFQRVWGEFGPRDELKAVLLKYYKNMLFYSEDTCDWEGFVAVLETQEYKVLSGRKETVVNLGEHIRDFTSEEETYLCKLEKPRQPLEGLKEIKVRDMKVEDLEDFFKLYNKIENFTPEGDEVIASVKKEFKDKTGRGYYIREDHQIVSGVLTDGESSTSAMIAAVCTHPEYRGRGYTSACVATLCKDLLDEGKILCLTYNNPAAGRIYRKIGFEDVDTWLIYRK